ncbi:hypothetical protein XENOCAPTIV_020795, partial [Xenoophorus captivus]
KSSSSQLLWNGPVFICSLILSQVDEQSVFRHRGERKVKTVEEDLEEVTSRTAELLEEGEELIGDDSSNEDQGEGGAEESKEVKPEHLAEMDNDADVDAAPEEPAEDAGGLQSEPSNMEEVNDEDSGEDEADQDNPGAEDADLSRNMPGKVKVSAPNLLAAKKK